MKHNTIAKTLAFAAVSAFALSIAPAANADDKGCSNDTLRGTFAYRATGSSVAPLPPGQYAEVGAQTFDGRGGTTANGMASINGSAMPSAATGAYTVNSDCTGTFTLEIAPGLTAHYFFVIADGGAEYQAVCLDPVAVLTRIGRRLYPGREI